MNRPVILAMLNHSLVPADIFCMELFCGSGNLTYAMKHFFPDSFGVDHKVGNSMSKSFVWT